MKRSKPSEPDVCGIYFLFDKRYLTYVGKSQNCHDRIKVHRANGRKFDYTLVLPIPEIDLGWVEYALIDGLRPNDNRTIPSDAFRHPVERDEGTVLDDSHQKIEVTERQDKKQTHSKELIALAKLVSQKIIVPVPEAAKQVPAGSLMTKREVAEMLHFHPEHVMRLSREGKFPKPLKTGPLEGCAVRFMRSDVVEWIKSRLPSQG